MASSRAQRPHYILFAGINGAGKSTLYRSGLWENGHTAAQLPRVNSDEILVAHGWSWEDPAAQFRAGKEAVSLIREHLKSRESFNQESTLSGRSIMRTIRDAKDRGFVVSMHYVGVEDPQVANERIAHRKAIGGHGVSENTVLRRFDASMDNLVAAVDLCDKVAIYDNTFTMRLAARIEVGDLTFFDLDSPDISWPNKLVERLIALQ